MSLFLLAAVVAVTGCVPSHRPPGELEAPHAAKDLGVKVVTHEQATAEVAQILKVLTDFIPVHLGRKDSEYKQQCIVGNNDVSNGAIDSIEYEAEPVENYVDYAHRFVNRANSLGYRTESLWPSNGNEEAWFTYRDVNGAVIEVALYPDRSSIGYSSRCYEYDWPELTPTPSPSGG